MNNASQHPESTDSSPVVTASSESIDKDGSIKKKLNEVNVLLYALVLTLFLGFTGMFIGSAQILVDSLRDKRDSTYKLQEKIDDQNDLIESLSQKVDEMRQSSNEQRTKNAQVNEKTQ